MQISASHRESGRLAASVGVAGVLCLLLAACSHPRLTPVSVLLHIDGAERAVTSPAPTVRELLDGLGVALGPLDQVEPPLWTPLSAAARITVTRQWEEIEQQPLTYTVQTVRDEFLPPAASAVITPGSAGLEELTYHVAYDGPTLLQRTLVSRRVVSEPVAEVRLLGTLGTLPSTPFDGTIAYLCGGDAWVMRGTSEHKRKLTEGAQLDGRVFDLSPDGRTLIYTARAESGQQALNTLWSLDTVVLNAGPVATGLTNVVRADWAPASASEGRIACVSGAATPGAPGWKSLNDLRLLAWPSLAETPILPPTASFVYAWWGETWTWRPDGQRLAYARADAIGLLELADGQRRALVDMPPAPAEGDEVWLPSLAWSPDGGALLAVVCRRGGDAPRHDLVLINAADGQTQTLYANVGQDASVAWSPTGARVALWLGAETQPAAPLRVATVDVTTWGRWTAIQPTQPDILSDTMGASLCWSPDGTRVLLLSGGDLFLLDPTDGTTVALTASGLVSRVQWRP